MANQRILLQKQYPELISLGIPFFGHYNNQTPTDKLVRNHHGSCYEICYLASGMQPYCIYPNADSKEDESILYRLYGGDVFITKPYEYHSSGGFQQLKGNLYWILIDSECPTLLNQCEEQSNVLKEALGTLCTPLLRLPKSISKHFTEAFDLLMINDKTRFFRACHHLSLFILELADYNMKIAEDRALQTPLSPKILEAVSYIQNNLLNPKLDVQNIADHLFFSRSYIMTEFHREMGLTMHEYILRTKIDFGCELLDSYSITETSYLLNFSSSQHFSNIFKKYMGITPRDYQTRKK